MEDTVQQDAPATATVQTSYVAVVADIVSAYVSNNSVPAHELGALIASVHASITGIENGEMAEPEAAKREPAVSVKKSMGNGDYLISMIDGKQYRTLKRHLGTHGMTPEDYRHEFGLPASYPMVAPAYSAKRSALAKEIGLGNSRGDTPKPVRLTPKEPGSAADRAKKRLNLPLG